MDVEIEAPPLETVLSDLRKFGHDVQPSAVDRAARRAARKFITLARRDLARQLGVKQKNLRGRLKLEKTARGRPKEVLFQGEGLLPIHRLEGMVQAGAGVEARVGGQARLWPGSFLIRARSGKLVAGRRKGRDRDPLVWPGVALSRRTRRVARRVLEGGEVRAAYEAEYHRQLRLLAAQRMSRLFPEIGG